jgi:hypothetical protein
MILGMEAKPMIANPFQFRPDGPRLAWADSDGTVDVTDLDKVRRSDRPIERK